MIAQHEIFGCDSQLVIAGCNLYQGAPNEGNQRTQRIMLFRARYTYNIVVWELRRCSTQRPLVVVSHQEQSRNDFPLVLGPLRGSSSSIPSRFLETPYRFRSSLTYLLNEHDFLKSNNRILRNLMIDLCEEKDRINYIDSILQIFV